MKFKMPFWFLYITQDASQGFHWTQGVGVLTLEISEGPNMTPWILGEG